MFGFLECFGFRLGEGIENDEESEKREENDGGKLGEIGESQEKSGEDDIGPRRILEEAHEEIRGEKNEGGDADIGCNVVTVPDDIGVGGVEKKREKSGKCSRELSCPAENHISQKKRDEDDGKARDEGDGVGIIAFLKQKSIAETPLGESPVLGGSLGVIGRVYVFITSLPESARDGEIKSGEREYHRESREVFDERRMLGVNSHIKVLYIAVGSRNMRLLIHRGRIVPGKLNGECRKGDENYDHEPRAVFFEEFHRVIIYSQLTIYNLITLFYHNHLEISF